MLSAVLVVLILSPFPLQSLSAGLGPGARINACTFVFRNTLYVWGGTVSPSYPYSNFTSTTLPLSTTNSIVWTDLSWDIPPYLTNINQPIPIWPCVVSPAGILVVGGATTFGYDLVANTYVPLNTTGDSPPVALSSRANVRMVQVKDSFYIFGGYSVAVPQADFYILNLTTWKWTAETVSNPLSIPPAYSSSSLAYGDNGFIYMFGGSQNTTYYSDIYKFDIGVMTWSTVIPTNGIWNSGFDKASAVAYEGTIYIFYGGANGGTSGVAVNGVHFRTNAIHIYDVVSNVATEQTTYVSSQYAPPPDVSFPIAVANDAVISVSGSSSKVQYLLGVWVYNMSAKDWTTTVAAVATLATSTSTSTSISASTSTSTPRTTSISDIAVIVGPIAAATLNLGVIATIIIIHVRRRRRNHERSNIKYQNPVDEPVDEPGNALAQQLNAVPVQLPVRLEDARVQEVDELHVGPDDTRMQKPEYVALNYN